MDDLTDKQLAVLNLIRQEIELGEVPTTREIAEKLGRDPKSISQHLLRIERKGYIVRKPGKSRNIRLTNKAVKAPGIPLVGQVAAGQPILAEENLDGRVDIEGYFGPKGSIFLLRVQGESMRDAGICNNDLVAVRIEGVVKNGGIAVALVGDEVTVKRVYKEGHNIRLEPANPEFSALVADTREGAVRVVGPVTGLIRRMP